MDSQPWFSSVRQRLAKHGLPPNYVQRFVEELTDHFHDLTEESMSTESDAYSRLGEPEQVAEAAVTAYKRRSFLGRHPAAAFLVFGVSPVVSFIVLIVLAVAPLEICDRIGVKTDNYLAGLRQFAPYVLSLWTVVTPGILASILYCCLARRLGIGKKWMLLSCAILAVLAAMPICSVKLSDIPGESALRWGVPNFWGPQGIRHLSLIVVWVFCRPRQLMQFLVPLSIGWWFLRRKRDQGQLQLQS